MFCCYEEHKWYKICCYTQFSVFPFSRWFFVGFRRTDAEKQLALSGEDGAFIVRYSETIHGEYALSVRDHDAIKHYRIERNPTTGTFFMSQHMEFDDVIALVNFHKKNPGIAGLRLKFPCPKKKPSPEALSRLNLENCWEIPRESLQFVEVLGKGNFGEVWKGVWNGTTNVAVKMLREGGTEQSAILQEAQIMKDLQHANLVRLFAVCTVGKPILIVEELMCNGSLLKYLDRYRSSLRMPHLVSKAQHDQDARILYGILNLNQWMTRLTIAE